MHREIIYFENGVQIARAYSQNNEHSENGDIDSLFSELRKKIAQKENGNNKWNWKEELNKAFTESFPYLRKRENSRHGRD